MDMPKSCRKSSNIMNVKESYLLRSRLDDIWVSPTVAQLKITENLTITLFRDFDFHRDFSSWAKRGINLWLGETLQHDGTQILSEIGHFNRFCGEPYSELTVSTHPIKLSTVGTQNVVINRWWCYATNLSIKSRYQHRISLPRSTFAPNEFSTSDFQR